jgi:hypothetical protein
VPSVAWTLYILAALAAALAWVVARRRPAYLPIAGLLTFQIATDLIRLGLRELVFMPHYPKLGGAPATGWLRVAAHVEQTLFIGWRVGIAALAVWFFGKRKPWALLAAYAITEVILIAGYPTIRGELLQRAYLGIELAVLCVSIGFFIRWYFGRAPWTLEHVVVGLIIALEAAMVTGGPYRGIIWFAWDRAWAILLVLYVALIAIEGWVWFRSRD